MRRRNPMVAPPGSRGYEEKYRPLADLTDAEIKGLCLHAFLHEGDDENEVPSGADEWAELSDDQWKAVLGDTNRNDATIQIDGQEVWPKLLTEEQIEWFIENDSDCKWMVENLTKIFIQRYEQCEPDGDHATDSAFESLRYYLQENADHLVERAEESGYEDDVNEIVQRFSAEGYSVDQIKEAIDVAMRDSSHYNEEYGDEDSPSFLKEQVEGYLYFDSADLKLAMRRANLHDFEIYTDQELEKMIEKVNLETDNIYERRHRSGLSVEALRAGRFSIETSETGKYAYIDFNPNWFAIESEVENELEHVEPEGANYKEREKLPELPLAQRIVHRFKDGSYVVELVPSEMIEEGAPYTCDTHGHFYPPGQLFAGGPKAPCPQCVALARPGAHEEATAPRSETSLHMCIGAPSQRFVRALKAGTGKAWSLRTAGGKRKIAIFADMSKDKRDIRRIDQAKGKFNRLPGFEASKHGGSGREGKFKPQEVAQVAEFIATLGIDPYTVHDVLPGMQRMVHVAVAEHNQEASKLVQKLKEISPEFRQRLPNIETIALEASAIHENPARRPRVCRECGGEAGGFCG